MPRYLVLHRDTSGALDLCDCEGDTPADAANHVTSIPDTEEVLAVIEPSEPQVDPAVFDRYGTELVFDIADEDFVEHEGDDPEPDIDHEVTEGVIADEANDRDESENPAEPRE